MSSRSIFRQMSIGSYCAARDGVDLVGLRTWTSGDMYVVHSVHSHIRSQSTLGWDVSAETFKYHCFIRGEERVYVSSVQF